MLYNFLKLYFRTFLQKFSISLVTIGGLAFGMASCLLILSHISAELSYDRFHSKKDRIYRMVWEYGDNAYTTRIQPIVGETIKDRLAEIGNVVRFFSQDATLSVEDGNLMKVLKEENIVYSDPSVFDIFDFNIKAGSREPFNSPYSLVLSGKAAKKYFDQEDPIGHRISLRNMFGTVDYTVRAVIEDIPINSSIQFDVLVTNEHLFSEEMFARGILYWGAFDTFILTKSNLVNIREVENTVNSMASSEDPDYGSFFFQKLEDIHLKSTFLESETIGMSRIYAFSTIAIVILILAWFNFINISTARSLERIRESGIRKVLGSDNLYMLRQYLFDSAMTNLISLLLSIGFVEIISEGISNYTNITLNPLSAIFPIFLLLLGAVFVMGILFTAIIPYLFFRKLKPYEALTYKLQGVGPGRLLRRILTLTQFSASFFLLIFTFIIFRQVYYMENKELGFETEKVLVISAPDTSSTDLKARIQSFGNRLKDTNWFRSISISSAVPGMGYNYGTISRQVGSTDADKFQIKVTYIDSSFVEHYELKLEAGVSFSGSESENRNRVVLNEASVGSLGFSSATESLGKKIYLGENEIFEIIGVLKDYHHTTLHSPIEPIAFLYTESGNHFSIKYQSESGSSVLTKIQDLYGSFFPMNAFDYIFLDELFKNEYLDDRRFGRLIAIFSSIALIIAIMGLYGMTELNAQKKVKEIGIRKVLGASSLQIFNYLSRNLFIMIILSVIAAIPPVVLISRKWLDQYAYKTEFTIYIVLIPFIVVFMISLFAISLKTVRASRTNPVESLRYE